jgi:hypothetical protein
MVAEVAVWLDCGFRSFSNHNTSSSHAHSPAPSATTHDKGKSQTVEMMCSPTGGWLGIVSASCCSYFSIAFMAKGIQQSAHNSKHI